MGISTRSSNRGDVKFGAAASGGAGGWSAPAVALRGGGESKVSSEAIAKQEHLPTHKLTRTAEENDTSLACTWRNPAGGCSSYKWYARYILLQMSLSLLVLPLVRVLESLVSWCYGPFGFMMLTIVPLAFRSPILGMHELGGCAVTGGYSIIFWYICNAWIHLGVVVYWSLTVSVPAGSGDGSVSLGPEFVAIWDEHGGSGRQYARTVGIEELEVVSGMNGESSGLVVARLVLLSCVWAGGMYF